MPTYSDEVNVYNPNAIDDAIGEAATTATSYITSVTSDGIMVADANKGASNGSITANTTGWHIGGVLEFIRNGVARFWIGLKNQNDTTPTVRIGKAFVNGASDNESHMELDYHSLQLIDKEGDTYFHVSDLRDADGYLTETFKGNGTTKVFTVSLGVSSVASVKVNNTETSAYTRNGTTFTFTTAPTNGADVAIRYKPATTATKAYTMGKRASGNIGIFSVAEGYGTTASGARSHAEGWNTTASDIDSHAEGHGTTASGADSHAEGNGTTASGNHSHAEGNDTTASGNNSHAEGSNTTASGDLSHTEGSLTTASGDYSHAEGYSSQAIGDHSHAQNHGTKASSDSQTAIGKFNVEDDSDTYALIVGNGTADSARSNALAVRWDGTIECASDTDWTTLNSTIKYRIHHGVCYVVGISANVTQVATGGTVVGTLPTEARPTIDVEGAATTMGNNCGQWKVGTNGQITVWGFGSATKYWAFTASYPL